jgi:hypothetical protein
MQRKNMTRVLEIDSDRHDTLGGDAAKPHTINETFQYEIKVRLMGKQYLFYRGLVHQKMEFWISEPFSYLLFLERRCMRRSQVDAAVFRKGLESFADQVGILASILIFDPLKHRPHR